MADRDPEFSVAMHPPLIEHSTGYHPAIELNAGSQAVIGLGAITVGACLEYVAATETMSNGSFRFGEAAWVIFGAINIIGGISNMVVALRNSRKSN